MSYAYDNGDSLVFSTNPKPQTPMINETYQKILSLDDEIGRAHV